DGEGSGVRPAWVEGDDAAVDEDRVGGHLTHSSVRRAGGAWTAGRVNRSIARGRQPGLDSALVTSSPRQTVPPDSHTSSSRHQPVASGRYTVTFGCHTSSGAPRPERLPRGIAPEVPAAELEERRLASAEWEVGQGRDRPRQARGGGVIPTPSWD